MSVNFEFISDRLRNHNIKTKEEAIDEELVYSGQRINRSEQSSGEDTQVSDAITSDHNYGQDMETDSASLARDSVTPSVSTSSSVTAIERIDKLLSDNQMFVEQVSKMSPWSSDTGQSLDTNDGTCSDQQGANKTNSTKIVGSVISPKICSSEDSNSSRPTSVRNRDKSTISAITSTNANKCNVNKKPLLSPTVIAGKMQAKKLIIINQNPNKGQRKVLVKGLKCSLNGCSKVFLHQSQLIRHLKDEHNKGCTKLSINTCESTSHKSPIILEPVRVESSDGPEGTTTITLRQVHSSNSGQAISVEPSKCSQPPQLVVQSSPQMSVQTHNSGTPPPTSSSTVMCAANRTATAQFSPIIVKPMPGGQTNTNHSKPGQNSGPLIPITLVPVCWSKSPSVVLKPVSTTTTSRPSVACKLSSTVTPRANASDLSASVRPHVFRSLAEMEASPRLSEMLPKWPVRTDNTIPKPTIRGGCAIEVQLKEAIINLKDYFERQNPNWSNNRVIEEIAKATKVGENSIWTIIKYFNEHRAFKEPKKTRNSEKKYVCSDEDRHILEKCIHKLKDENRLNGVIDIYKELMASDQFGVSFKGCGQQTFYRMFSKSGFRITQTMIVNKKPSEPQTKEPKVDGKYECPWPECGKTFSRREFYVLHERTHTQEKPYACRQPGCQYKCAALGNFNKHLKVHGITTTKNISFESSND